ncbi:TetR/AcrR family transcriptional regulator [Janibacter anophelis]|uniref:TetR/AcrR family transcriptional regulator n=1 Tax=Janibacter anophelis TaxID=319054 RepID=UPI0013B0565F|nr:TetR/AcrR family transcriptional regulator [Janibacter anophelis]
MSSRATAAEDTRERIRTAALALFAERGVAATSLREVARSAGVAPGLVGHYFGSKDGLHEAVEDGVVALFVDTLDAVSLEGPVATVVANRDRAIHAMFVRNPHVVDYLRRVVVTPGSDDTRLVRKMLDTQILQTQRLRDHGIAASRAPVAEQAVTVLVRQLGTWLLQPALDRLWRLSGAHGPSPEVRVTLR